MKKIYKTPLVRTALIDVNSIIASSPVITQKEGEIEDPNEVMVRDDNTTTNLWDNEW